MKGKENVIKIIQDKIELNMIQSKICDKDKLKKKTYHISYVLTLPKHIYIHLKYGCMY